MLIKRREFIQVGSLATASMLLPKFLRAFDKKAMLPPGNKVVVVVQFSGGNDGLNTIIPVRNDIYYSSRPTIGIAQTDTLSLTSEVGINPALQSLKGLYDDGSLGILNNVGYPNPNRSHFRSMDIWQTASNSDEYINNGWIGRYLDTQCNNCSQPVRALEIDDTLSLALKGADNNGLAFKDPKRLFNFSNENYFKDINNAHHHEEATADYLYKVMSETLSSADYIFQQSKLHQTTATYPDTAFAKDLKTIASLIFSDITTKVYYVSIGSFDTHVNQAGQQKRLFTEFSDGIKAFTDDLKKNNRFDDVLLFTFSEFGRRVAQNASGGTDHGTANNMFLISSGLKEKGIINAMPDLTDLDEGDLKYNINFKNVYATILNKWLGTDDKTILGGQYDYLNFI